jgi:cysteine desulfuration protein SufE
MTNLLTETIAEFADLDPRERLEMLLEYSENLPPLPDEYEQQRLAGEHRIHECQTPVFLWITLLQNNLVQMHGWVAPEAPTVKGFVGILQNAFHQQPPEVVLNAPNDLLKQLGLAEALGMMRTRGLSAVLFYLRKQVERAIEQAPKSP